MARKSLPLHLVTLFHPEHWLKVRQDQLESFPHIKRDRKELEKNKSKVAKERKLDTTPEELHHDSIINFGDPEYNLRKTWIDVDKLVTCLEDFDVRLIYTKETRPQARWRFEFRPDWVDQPGILDKEINYRLLFNIRSEIRISIRQLWKNPVSARFGTLPLEVPAEIANVTANLVIGPFNKECNREANLEFKNINGIWWLFY